MSSTSMEHRLRVAFWLGLGSWLPWVVLILADRAGWPAGLAAACFLVAWIANGVAWNKKRLNLKSRFALLPLAYRACTEWVVDGQRVILSETWRIGRARTGGWRIVARCYRDGHSGVADTAPDPFSAAPGVTQEHMREWVYPNQRVAALASRAEVAIVIEGSSVPDDSARSSLAAACTGLRATVDGQPRIASAQDEVITSVVRRAFEAVPSLWDGFRLGGATNGRLAVPPVAEVVAEEDGPVAHPGGLAPSASPATPAELRPIDESPPEEAFRGRVWNGARGPILGVTYFGSLAVFLWVWFVASAPLGMHWHRMAVVLPALFVQMVTPGLVVYAVNRWALLRLEGFSATGWIAPSPPWAMRAHVPHQPGSAAPVEVVVTLPLRDSAGSRGWRAAAAWKCPATREVPAANYRQPGRRAAIAAGQPFRRYPGLEARGRLLFGARCKVAVLANGEWSLVMVLGATKPGAEQRRDLAGIAMDGWHEWASEAARPEAQRASPTYAAAVVSAVATPFLTRAKPFMKRLSLRPLRKGLNRIA